LFMAFLIPSVQISSVFLVLSFVSPSTSVLLWIIFFLPLSEHGVQLLNMIELL
jgi:hypothetical protein